MRAYARVGSIPSLDTIICGLTLTRRTKLFIAALNALIGLGIWSVVIEPGQIKFKEHPIYIEKWPAALSGFSIAFITDTHVGSPHITLERMQSIVDMTNALKPDLILLGGDYVIQGVLGGHPVPSKDIVAVLSKLHATNGVFGILGNHDWWDNAERIHHEFDADDVRILEDAVQHIQIGNNGFWIAGVSDYTEGAHDIGKALASITGNDPVIIVTHSPDIFPDVPASVGLTVAGHTHGGQVYIPLLGRPVIPSRYGQRYAMGLIEENGKQLFVGSGIGTSILPIRFMTPPEVSILKLYPRKNGSEKPVFQQNQ